MALQTEIDALLAEATAQGVTLSEVLTQVHQRQADQVEPDPSFSTALPMNDDPSPDWEYWIDWVADQSLTMGFDLAWNRLWSMMQLAKLNPTFYGGGNAQLYMFALVRILAIANQANSTTIKYSAKTAGFLGGAEIA
jgi:hypothetical protein